jgi:hypothetical protein
MEHQAPQDHSDKALRCAVTCYAVRAWVWLQATLPSKCETFFCTSDLPHGRYGNQKTKDLLVSRDWSDSSRVRSIATVPHCMPVYNPLAVIGSIGSVACDYTLAAVWYTFKFLCFVCW